MIKQVIPIGWVKSPIPAWKCGHTGIMCSEIVTGWVRRGGKREPIQTAIIKECDLAKAESISAFYASLKVKG